MSATLLQLVVTLLLGGGLGALLNTFFRHKRGVREETDDQAVKLLEQQAAMIVRLTKLERETAQERALCEARLQAERHRINNLDTNFDAMLLLYEVAPERASEWIAKFKERRAQQREAEAIEKAAITAATVKAETLDDAEIEGELP